jgi:hypothetical protein
VQHKILNRLGWLTSPLAMQLRLEELEPLRDSLDCG